MPTNPRFFITGASGALGRLVVAALARRVGVDSVVAIARDPAAAAPHLPSGIELRQGDYALPETLDAALAGAERLLLISSNAIGQRVGQHANVIAAAGRAGVARIAYTSILHADTSILGLAQEHRQTEALIRDSGIAHVLLRNGWYSENYAASIPAALQHGVMLGSAGTGRIASAARIDYAEAAAAALIDDALGPDTVFELAGDGTYTLVEFAAELSRQTGRDIGYQDMPEAEYRAVLAGAGLPQPLAEMLADSDAGAAKDALFDDSGTLGRLIGRATTPLARTIAAALAE